jgi:hypothetical protein
MTDHSAASPDEMPEGERFVAPRADRPPTPDEAAAADRAATNFHFDAAGEHFQEMAERGANVEGEGQIERDA